MDAFTLLEEDHRRAESLLTALRSAPSGERSLLVSELGRLLEEYEGLEETAIYPELRHAQPTSSLVRQSEQAYARMRTQVAALEVMDTATPAWQEAFHSLEIALRHHFQQEQNALFPTARKALSREQLEQMTQRVSEHRATAAERAAGEAGLAPGTATTASAVARTHEKPPAAERAENRRRTRPAEAASTLHLPSEQPESRSASVRRKLDSYYHRVASNAARPGVWFGGAVVAGVVLSSLLRAAGREKQHRIAYPEEMSHGRIREQAHP